MSYGSSPSWEGEKVDASSFQPFDRTVSVMRDFLEYEVDFKWSANMGECSGNHCDISGDKIPLKWGKIISDKTNASIDMYEAGPDISFKKPFVVKTIRERDSQKAREMTATEVKNMKDLRHPHVTALLGTFTYQARLSILIFPAACCDLHQFMKRMSRGFEKDWVASHLDGSSTVDSETVNSRRLLDTNVSSSSEHKENDPQEVHSEPWPLNIPVAKKIELLRGYFVCLSQALGYLHGSGVRHKDIKPENILIDESGSVILTDFGISRRFPKHTPHATNNERKFTRKYASPEIMKDKDTLRDDPSDVFSLGCVFLEMATLLHDKNLNNLSDYYATIVNDSVKEEAYHYNLGSVHSWIDYLRISRGFKPVQEHWLLGEMNKVQTFDPSPENHMTAALADIRQMLDETPSNRPVSNGLWQRFQHISATRCRDCDPRRPGDIWKPSARQQRDAQTGFNRRRSLHAIEERYPLSKELSVSGDIDSTTLSPQLISQRSLRKPRQGSSPSIDLQKYGRHGHIKTRSEPESPMLQLRVDTQEDRAKAASSPSPRLRVVQKEGLVPKEISPELAQASAHISPADVNHETSIDIGRQISDNVEPTPSLPKPQATKLDLSKPLAFPQDQQSRAPNQRRATGVEAPVSEPKEYTPLPQTRIIVYDVSQTIAFETVFASLKDQDPKRYPLPRFRQRVEIGDKADLIAKVDLRQLKLGTKMRRWMGSFAWIYVLNNAAQPLQTASKLSP
ncbi:hypothetical protein HO133_005878 [Letharia lupina]|uniref:non-specific serine/threonine protein kinase n=1 Tax=Letharia lupina TaxID=560253 RepID=A0A8H6C8D3_9LECA|nr:uncharacterized protein HO133_005878 [Letharia lupina]KAF6218529.1 hypothetical protein HO133_005878 [Letharia lupina]